MFQTISMRRLEFMLDGERNFTLLDVRERSEYARSHLEGAVNLPLSELENNYSMLAADRPVVIYCAHGGQSLLASRVLDRLGFEVINTSGGLSYYRGAHLISEDFSQTI